MTTASQHDTIRSDFNRDGFVVVPDLLSPRELAELRRKVDGVLDGTIRPDLPVKVGDDPSDFTIQWEPGLRDNPEVARRDKVRIVFHMTHTHTWFRELALSPTLLDVVEALIGPNIRLYTDQMFVKPARHGSEVPWHQDAAYWPAVEPRLLSCWIAIDDVTLANGCLRFIPGSHRAVIDHHVVESDNPNKITIRPGGVDEKAERLVEMPAGGVEFHHALAAHRSMPNQSDRGRRALVIVYMPADTKFHRPWNFPYGFPMIRGR